MPTATQFFTLGALVYLNSCAHTPTAPPDFVTICGPPLESLGLKEVEPSEVIVREIPDAAFRNKESTSQWTASLQKMGLMPLGFSNHISDGSPNETTLKRHAADCNAQIVYTKTRYMGRDTKTIPVPILFSPGQTVMTSSTNYGTVNANTYGAYGYGSGTGTYNGHTSSFTYIPPSTIYAPKEVTYNAYSVITIYCVPPGNISQRGLKLIAEYQRQLRNTNR